MKSANIDNFEPSSMAYVRYCLGSAFLQTPEKFVDVHHRPDIEAGAEDIVVKAEDLMIRGIRNFIKSSLPETISTLHQASSRFEEVYPYMWSNLLNTVVTQERQLYNLNPRFTTVMPAPFIDKVIFSDITHGNYKRIYTEELLDGFLPSLRFEQLLQNRKVSYHASRNSELKIIRSKS